MDSPDVELMPAITSSANQIVVQQQQDEMKMLVSVAQQYPRNPEKALEQARAIILMDPETAEDSYYVLPAPQGGSKPLIGPSIRMAEIIAQQWGRVVFDSRLVDQDERTITVQGRAMDLQNMTTYSETLTRSIWSTKQGKRYSESVIINTIRSAQSIVVRNCILKIVPRAYANKLVQEAMAIVEGKEKSLEERREAALQYGEKLGLTEKEMCAYLGVESSMQIGPDALRNLRGVFTAIRDGMVSLDVFRPKVERTEVEPPVMTATVSAPEAARKTPSAPQEPEKSKTQRKPPTAKPVEAPVPVQEPPAPPVEEEPEPTPPPMFSEADMLPAEPEPVQDPPVTAPAVTPLTLVDLATKHNVGRTEWKLMVEHFSPLESDPEKMDQETLERIYAHISKNRETS